MCCTKVVAMQNLFVVVTTNRVVVDKINMVEQDIYPISLCF
jgi:hypothetical protein